MASIQIIDLEKHFGEVKALSGINLEIDKGEFFTLLGPSGCGKTTLLRTIAGFYHQDKGDIYIDGELINNVPAYQRNTGMVFQNYAVFPHMTVFDNVAYGLRVRKLPKDEISRKVSAALKSVHLEGYEQRTPEKLSGGQQQRVAFARALSLEPKVLLLDEPLSNLDANLRLVMREEIRKLQERLHITTVFVTHDQFEAMAISDRLVVMKDGLIEQVGTPIEIYERPANEFIAGFVGYVNFMDGKIVSIDRGKREAAVRTEFGEIRIDLRQEEIGEGDDVLMVIRPESVTLGMDCGRSGNNRICGMLKSYMYAGSIAKCTVTIGDKKMIVDQYNPRDAMHFKNAEKIELEIPRSVHLLKKNA